MRKQPSSKKILIFFKVDAERQIERKTRHTKEADYKRIAKVASPLPTLYLRYLLEGL